MKTLKYVLFAASAMALAACNSETPADSADSELQSGYASFVVNLPTTSDTRAVVDAKGDASEYAVANGKVLVFRKAASEGAATFVCAAELSGMNWSAAADGEVTTTTDGVARIDNIDMLDNNAQYGALVVLNCGSDFVLPTAGQTLSAWSNTAQNGTMLYQNGGSTFITMTSAAKYAGAGAEPVILADLDKSKIFQTADKAASAGAPAATMFVQRNVAKVTITNAFSGTIADGLFKDDAVQLTGWALDVVNKTTYPMQVTEGLSASYADIWKGGELLNRFFGNGTKFSRVYFAKDPNFDKDITTAEAIAQNFTTIREVNSNPACLYALENTFDINHQVQGQTTRVVLKATYTPAGMTAGTTFFQIGTSSELCDVAGLIARIKAAAGGSADVTLGDVAAKAGSYSLSDIAITVGGTRLTDAQYATVAGVLGLTDANVKGINTFINGVTYYVVRVKHFGEDTPWVIGNPTYGGDNYKWLGRYGMVRNNWYEVNIAKFSAPGAPVVPEIDPVAPDDENSYFISAKVNILSWAKRVQNVDL